MRAENIATTTNAITLTIDGMWNRGWLSLGCAFGISWNIVPRFSRGNDPCHRRRAQPSRFGGMNVLSHRALVEKAQSTEGDVMTTGTISADVQQLEIAAGNVLLAADAVVPENATGVVLFAHGS